MYQYHKEPETSIHPDSITNDGGFWPDIVIADFVKEARIPPQYDDGKQYSALVRAMATANIELKSWTARQIEQGKTRSDDAGQIIGGVGVATSLYKDAVYNRAKANLLTHFATVNRKDEAEALAKESQDTYDRLITEYQKAIRTIQDTVTASVRLL